MAANMQLPVIHDLSLSNRNAEQETGRARQQNPTASKKKEIPGSSFLSRLQLGSLEQHPQPGDVYRGPMYSKHPRPLGLIPGREDRMAALKKLNQLLSPWSQTHGQVWGEQPSLSPHRGTRHPLPPSESTEEPDFISATVQQVQAPVETDDSRKLLTLPTALTSSDPTAFRLSSKGMSEAAMYNVTADPDYMGDRASEYYTLTIAAPVSSPKGSPRHDQKPSDHLGLPQNIPILSCPKGDKKKAKLKRHFHGAVSNRRYFNFTGQAQLFERLYTEEKREGVEYEPCERCRLRGGRCARCKAIRTGGGYIILDEGENSNLVTSKRRKGFDWKWSGNVASMTEGGGRRKMTRRTGLEGAEESPGGGADWSGDAMEIARASRTSGSGGGSGGRWEGGSGVGGRSGEEGRVQERRSDERGLSDGRPDLHNKPPPPSRDQADTGHSEGDWSGGRGEGDADGGGRSISERSEHEGREGSSTDTKKGGRPPSDHNEVRADSGRENRTSRPGSKLGKSRPGSTLGTRPGSSLRHSGRGFGGKRTNRSGDTHKDGSGQEGDDDTEGRGRRRKGNSVRRPHADDGDSNYQGSEFMHLHTNEADDGGNKPSYHGNLRKFKRPRDEVKALHATMKELQGIDPLDYLAKYCIIDQNKVPHYQHVFNNVDRDEDDEIDIAELDFALKAVNYDLISDAEMNYVNSVLELASRHKLNFRLFSLIAALSEKVVALEDMVKRLINKMDFDALEVKMKKCKELFYLLADSDVELEYEGGVVTSSSLAVELQAGGLTQDHVEFVVDRLNHEGKGLVEFLDYLTYVPLFVEIHDSIHGNPLDFSRTK